MGVTFTHKPIKRGIDPGFGIHDGIFLQLGDTGGTGGTGGKGQI